MKDFLIRWAVTTVSVLVAANIVSGVTYDSAGALLVAALLLGVANAVLKPVLLLLTLPFVLLTFGSFILVINALCFWFVGWLVKGFSVEGFWSAFFGALIVSAVSFLLNALVWKEGRPRLFVRTPRPPPPGGEIIDIEKLD